MTEQAQPTSKRAEKVRAARRRRKGLGGASNMKLTLPEEKLDRKKFNYRWAKGEPQRIAQLTQYDDYDVVHDESLAEADKQAGLGIHPERFGGRDEQGKPYNMVLLRKPKELYEEDEAEKQKMVDEREAPLLRGVVKSPDGTQGLSGPNAYVPAGGISIKRGD